jgi:GntR family transcriptional repressor for pyruvate dehydrogenase complex
VEPEIAAFAASRIEEQLLAVMRDALATKTTVFAIRMPTWKRISISTLRSPRQSETHWCSLCLTRLWVLREQRGRIFGVDGHPERGQFHHKRILEAVERRDPDAAREAMRAHQAEAREDSAADQSQSKGSH